jgi:DNA/RNA endonuclease YhcR with UshA esterase domain
MCRVAPMALIASICLVPWSASAADTAVADQPAAVLASADAAAHVGEECTVEFTVEGGRRLPDKEICFLNSCSDHRDERNFTVVFFKAGLERMKADGIEDPAAHFEKATIRVRGIVEKRNGRPQVVVEEPGQITLVKKADDPDPPTR